VEPGDLGRFVFAVRAPEQNGEVSESFRLVDPAGELLRCPSPEVVMRVQVGSGLASAAEDPVRAGSGGLTGTICSAGEPGGGADGTEGLVLLVMAGGLLHVAARRRAKS
jgi:hypothetical protein